jgi:hypothetical protein
VAPERQNKRQRASTSNNDSSSQSLNDPPGPERQNKRQRASTSNDGSSSQLLNDPPRPERQNKRQRASASNNDSSSQPLNNPPRPQPSSLNVDPPPSRPQPLNIASDHDSEDSLTEEDDNIDLPSMPVEPPAYVRREIETIVSSSCIFVIILSWGSSSNQHRNELRREAVSPSQLPSGLQYAALVLRCPDYHPVSPLTGLQCTMLALLQCLRWLAPPACLPRPAILKTAHKKIPTLPFSGGM